MDCDQTMRVLPLVDVLFFSLFFLDTYCFFICNFEVGYFLDSSTGLGGAGEVLLLLSVSLAPATQQDSLLQILGELPERNLI